MMSVNEEGFEEIWISSNYETVFCTDDEKERYLNFLSSRKVIPRGMSIVLVKRRLNRKYTKEEIMKSTPQQIKAMIK